MADPTPDGWVWRYVAAGYTRHLFPSASDRPECGKWVWSPIEWLGAKPQHTARLHELRPCQACLVRQPAAEGWSP